MRASPTCDDAWKDWADYANYTEADKKRLDKTDWWRFLMNNGISQKDLDLREYADSTDFGESIRFVSAYAALAEYAESDETNEMDYKAKGGNQMIAKKLEEKIGYENIKLRQNLTTTCRSLLMKTSTN